MTMGLVVGKFYPPHRGHKHLIDSARSKVDHLIVMIAHHPSQEIPGEVRRDWLKEIHPDCDVRLVADELEDDSKQWAEFTVAWLGRAPDIVFSSEDYGPIYASYMGSQHGMIDRERMTIPISGTMVRSKPLRYLEYLEPCVRAWYLPRVVLVGAESTGKTTLAQRLAQRFQTEWVPEYGREHWEKKVANWTKHEEGPHWTSDEFVHIAVEQQRREDAAARKANRILFCDTNAFATGTWYERYFRDRHPTVDQLGLQCKSHLYLLTAPDVPFVQDGFRDGEKIREWMHQRFLSQLQDPAHHRPYLVLTGSYEARWERAKEACSRFLPEDVQSFSADN